MGQRRILFFFLAVLLSGFWGCGGNGSGNTGNDTPEELGKAIGDIYVQAITEVADWMAGKGDPGALKPRLETYREEVIAKLVKLGEKREAMGTADRAAVDRSISTVIMSIPREVYDRYNEGYKHYAGLDRETGNLIAGFNIITQYASFDLLKKQNPAEAKRLGIE